MKEYVIGCDVAASGSDRTAVCIMERRNGVLYYLECGQIEDALVQHFKARQLGISTTFWLLTLHQYCKSLPWYKRIWRKLMWNVFGRGPVIP